MIISIILLTSVYLCHNFTEEQDKWGEKFFRSDDVGGFFVVVSVLQNPNMFAQKIMIQ